jgi:FeS assembly SUF system protein
MDTPQGRRLNLPLDDDQHGEPTPRPNPAPPSETSLEEQVIAVLHTCYDPEIPVDIYELGLIYDLKVDPSGTVAIRMTLTSPACPVAGVLPGEVQSKVKALPGVKEVTVDLVWDPPWDKSRMSEAAQLQLGLFD